MHFQGPSLLGQMKTFHFPTSIFLNLFQALIFLFPQGKLCRTNEVCSVAAKFFPSPIIFVLSRQVKPLLLVESLSLQKPFMYYYSSNFIVTMYIKQKQCIQMFHVTNVFINSTGIYNKVVWVNRSIYWNLWLVIQCWHKPVVTAFNCIILFLY